MDEPEFSVLLLIGLFLLHFMCLRLVWCLIGSLNNATNQSCKAVPQGLKPL